MDTKVLTKTELLEQMFVFRFKLRLFGNGQIPCSRSMLLTGPRAPNPTIQLLLLYSTHIRCDAIFRFALSTANSLRWELSLDIHLLHFFPLEIAFIINSKTN